MQDIENVERGEQEERSDDADNHEISEGDMADTVTQYQQSYDDEQQEYYLTEHTILRPAVYRKASGGAWEDWGCSYTKDTPSRPRSFRGGRRSKK